MKFNTLKNQSGVAAIMFLLMFPLLFAVFVWGIEGSRAIQDSARLVDAVEVAALTVAAQDVDEEADCRAIAKTVVKAYFPSSIEVSVPAKTVTTPCISSIANRFDITASVEEATWFPKALASFGESYTVSNSMSVERDRLGAMDVVIAADYSPSMAAYEGYMVDTITQVATYIKNLNEKKLPGMPDSRLAIVGFDQFVKYTDSEGETYYTPHLVCTSTVGNSSNEYACNKENNTLINNKAHDEVYDHWNIGTYNNDSKGKISVDYTVDRVFDPIDYKDDNSGDKETGGNGGVTGNTVKFDSNSKYETIPFTNDFSEAGDIYQAFNTLPLKFEIGPANEFGAESASYTGLIQAAILMKDFGENRVRKIILLTNGDSDGDQTKNPPDPPFETIATQLFDAGLCGKIIDTITALKGENNLDVKFELFVINYDGSSPEFDNEGNATGSATVDKAIEGCAEEAVSLNEDDNLYNILPPSVVDYNTDIDAAKDKVELILSSMMDYMGRLLEDE